MENEDEIVEAEDLRSARQIAEEDYGYFDEGQYVVFPKTDNLTPREKLLLSVAGGSAVFGVMLALAGIVVARWIGL